MVAGHFCVESSRRRVVELGRGRDEWKHQDDRRWQTGRDVTLLRRHCNTSRGRLPTTPVSAAATDNNVTSLGTVACSGHQQVRQQLMQSTAKSNFNKKFIISIIFRPLAV